MIFNQIKTLALLAGLTGLLLYLGWYVGGEGGFISAIIFSALMNLFAYFFSDKVVLNLFRAQTLDPHRYREIYDIVFKLAEQMKLPMPKLWLVDKPMANAFATGRNPANASVAVTSGIMKILDKSELQGVLAHELSHVQNRDILVGSVGTTLASAIGFLSNRLYYGSAYQQTGSESKASRRNPLTTMLLYTMMPFAATLILLAISRNREYMADETGARITQDPLALATALEKMHTAVQRSPFSIFDMRKVMAAPLFIVCPFIPRGLLQLFSTHPPISDRIERLKKMASTISREQKS